MNVSPSAGRLPVRVSGRFGPRRLLVSECAIVIRAESVYDWLLREHAASVGPGAMARVTCEYGTFEAVVVSNAVWRRGRVFLRCPACARRCTRLYVPPLSGAALRCRVCWGLSYATTARNNYKGGCSFGSFFFANREALAVTALHVREQRRERSRERWAARRPILQALKPRAIGPIGVAPVRSAEDVERGRRREELRARLAAGVGLFRRR